MVKRVKASENGIFVLTGIGFEHANVHNALVADNKSVPVTWIENGYVTYIKEESEDV